MKQDKYVDEEDRWTPVRRRAVYCSPACGFKCTWAAYQAALRKGTALAKKLGEGWTADVWENGTWHWGAIDRTRLIKVHAGSNEYRGFTAYVEREIGHSGNFVVVGDTPRETVRAAIKQLREEKEYIVKLYGELLASCTGALGIKT